ncbi:sulfite exporter TauE/SafE family protein [Ideonella sp. 4Y16]|uniref:sulfite exporter TauE/SafE family protein n=1 Tax=Ideonella alba TaxID=2824118 RepID=UPI001B3856BC|nr:sulfite exporter TauE/SafE family protein [Ideonella alba]MBQ0945782.1 sulfite exporter TauE/SafE family protein [Ideonella alba]
MNPETWILLLTAALAAGALNAVAGGGSFLTFPALVFAGVPPIAANATSAVAVSPGYLGSTLGFRPELAALPRPRLWAEGAVCAAGGLAGAGLLLVTPAKLFSALVPWLLLFATALFALAPWLTGRRGGAAHPAARMAGLACVAVYGGYFNGGLGILLMALYAITGETSINTANALKNLNSLVLSLLSVAAFAWAGAVAWPQALAMALAATVGGYAGARVARRLPAKLLRSGVIATGLVMAALFFARG